MPTGPLLNSQTGRLANAPLFFWMNPFASFIQ
jgi:hypothetical protein